MANVPAMMTQLTELGSLLIVVLGFLAFLVSVIVQIIKNLPGLKTIPTDWVVLVLSILLAICCLEIYISYTQMVRFWYLYLAAFIFGFLVAFISMFGWSKLKEMWGRLVGGDMNEAK